MVYQNFKNLTRRTASDKILCDKASSIAKNLKYDGYQHGLDSMVYNFSNKKTLGGTAINENVFNKELAENYRNHLLKIPRKKV